MKKLLTALLLCCMLLGVTVASAQTPVEERADIGRPVITGEHTGLTCEKVTLTATMAGATKFRWYNEKNIPTDYYSYEQSTTDGTSSFYFYTSEEYTYRYAVKAYKDGEWSDFSDIFELSFEAPYGDMPLPEMAPLPFDVFAGEDLTIVAKPSDVEGADSVIEVWELREGGGRTSRWDGKIDADGVTVIPGDVFEAGKNFRIYVLYTGPGYRGVEVSEDYYNIQGSSAGEADACVTVSNPIIQCQTGEEASFTFRAKNALAWQIYRYFRYEQEWRAWESYGLGRTEYWKIGLDESPVLDEAELDGGEECAFSISWNSAEEIYFCARAYIKGHGWTTPSPIATMQATAPHGQLGMPSVQLIGELEEGMPTTIEYVVPAGTTNIELYFENDNDTRFLYDFIDIENPNGEKGRYTFPAQIDDYDNGYWDMDEWVCPKINLIDAEAGMDYRIRLVACGKGYDLSVAWIDCSLDPSAVVKEKPAVTGPETALTNETITLTATLQGATKFRWYTGRGIEEDRYSMEFTDCKGKSTFTYGADYATTVPIAVKAYKDGKWSALSDIVEVKFEAPYGAITLPEMDPLPFEVFAGKDLRIVAKRSEQTGVSSVIQLWDLASDTGLPYWEANINASGVTVIPGKMLREGKDIEIILRYTGKGYQDAYMYRLYYNLQKQSTVQADSRIKVSAQSIQCITGTEEELVFSAKDALAWQIYEYNDDFGEWSVTWSYYGLDAVRDEPVKFDESPEVDEALLDGGEECLYLIPVQDFVCMRYYCARAYIKGQGWTGPSPIVSVQMIAPNGALKKPGLRLIGELKPGKPVTIEYDAPAGTDYCYFYIERYDGTHYFSDYLSIENPNGEKGRYTFPEQVEDYENGHWNEESNMWVVPLLDLIEGAPGMKYEIGLTVAGKGYELNNIDILCVVGEKPEIVFDFILPESLTQIEESAFEGNRSICAVKCPAGLTSIGPRAFADCENLEAIMVPKGAVIDETAFEGCGDVDIQEY